MLEFLVSAFVFMFAAIAILGHALLFRAIMHGHGRVPDRGLSERSASRPQKQRRALPV
jgi:hypothetical protein